LFFDSHFSADAVLRDGDVDRVISRAYSAISCEL